MKISPPAADPEANDGSAPVMRLPSACEWIVATLAFTVLTVAATWPQVLQPDGIIEHRDSWFNMWRLGWIAHQLLRDPLRLFDANIHYPEPGTLAYSDAVLLEGAIAAPFIWSGVAIPYVHTGLIAGSFVLAGVGAWALVRTLTGSASAGYASGLIFAFTPYRFDHYMHLELLWTGWMPLTLLAIHRAVRHGSRAAGLLAGCLFLLQTLSSIYHAVFFATALVPFAAVLLWRRTRPAVRRPVGALLAGAVLAGALLLPYMLQYTRVATNVGERSVDEARLYSAGPTHYLAATPDNLLYGRWADRLGRPEKRLFPGLVATALTLVALWPRVSRLQVAYAAALAVAVDLSFGPRGVLFDWLYEYVPVYRGLRAPARAGGAALLMIAVLAGLGWARIQRAWRGKTSVRRAVAAASLLILAIEYAVAPRTLVPAPTQRSSLDEWLAAQPPLVLAEFPMPYEHDLPLHDARYAYRSTFHWQPLVNGYSGNVPASYVETLRAVHPLATDRAMARLTTAGVTHLVLHERLYPAGDYAAVTAQLDSRTDVRRLVEFGTAGERSVVYSVSRRDGPR